MTCVKNIIGAIVFCFVCSYGVSALGINESGYDVDRLRNVTSDVIKDLLDDLASYKTKYPHVIGDGERRAIAIVIQKYSRFTNKEDLAVFDLVELLQARVSLLRLNVSLLKKVRLGVDEVIKSSKEGMMQVLRIKNDLASKRG